MGPKNQGTQVALMSFVKRTNNKNLINGGSMTPKILISAIAALIAMQQVGFAQIRPDEPRRGGGRAENPPRYPERDRGGHNGGGHGNGGNHGGGYGGHHGGGYYPPPRPPVTYPTYPSYPSYPSYPTYPTYPSYPSYPSYADRTIYVGRYVSNETFRLTDLASLYSYTGYRISSVEVVTAGYANGATFATMVLTADQMVQSTVSSRGESVMMFPQYRSTVGYDVNVLRLQVLGTPILIDRIIVHLSR